MGANEETRIIANVRLANSSLRRLYADAFLCPPEPRIFGGEGSSEADAGCWLLVAGCCQLILEVFHKNEVAVS